MPKRGTSDVRGSKPPARLAVFGRFASSSNPGRAPVPAPPPIPDHELISWIGGGSYGEVWLARNVLGARRAVKIVHRQSFEEQEGFDREFNGLKKFEPISRTHEGLVDILQVGRTPNCLYYVMELSDDAGETQNVEGGEEDANRLATGSEDSGSRAHPAYSSRTLRSDLAQRGRLPVGEWVEIGLKLTSALGHLHKRGLVHRDIKPSNIIFVDGQPKLADIGLVTEITNANSFVGTVGYIPREGPGSAQADLYSLGKVLYEISTGRDRREFPKLPADLRGLSDSEGLIELNEIVLKACESDLKIRYATAEAMHGHLERVQEGKSIRHIRWLERRLNWVKRLAAAFVFLSILGGTTLWHTKQAERRTREHLSQLHLSTGTTMMEEGDLFGALLHMTKALVLEQGHPVRERAQRARIQGILGQLPQPIGVFRDGSNEVTDAVFSPDGRTLATVYQSTV